MKDYKLKLRNLHASYALNFSLSDDNPPNHKLSNNNSKFEDSVVKIEKTRMTHEKHEENVTGFLLVSSQTENQNRDPPSVVRN